MLIFSPLMDRIVMQNEINDLAPFEGAQIYIFYTR
ncbi:hypothetical protein SGRA_2771 [Saprospira grandis str. Lewin]|uniref:Uncharacterized protein n=1 Tax=Saprospira grandis (strain Lewin) TaxID=984262 RepID=H6LA31_SAPGL|nr:hypothetical protein SGRA_2771 [Saprospira grandis str. Lewin]